MFTGIVRGCGRVLSFSAEKNAWRLAIAAPKNFPPLKIGGSLSVDGVCLTVSQKKGAIYFFDVVAETVRRTTLGKYKKGVLVNLEPALEWKERIEGHFVQGHVDGIGTLLEISRRDKDVCFQIKYPVKLKPFLIEKGSIAVNGVSLTLGPVKANQFYLYLIPHTLKLSNFNQLKPGDQLNLEADLMVKFFRTL